MIAREVSALALWGSGFITASVATTLINRPPRHDTQLLVDHCRQCSFVRRVRDPGVFCLWSQKQKTLRVVKHPQGL